jgi:hypothetical protein
MKNKYLKVEGHENLYRDSATGAIVNREKRSPKNFTEEFNNVVNDINSLKGEIFEIKSLLKSIVENVIKS